ncbi:MAG: hypothetical protein QNJ53_00070 [Pleurocapsa sp. MO_192.B19]|nr:hypothetical protein [Pleurocapsa sp. MO_192.B19]
MFNSNNNKSKSKFKNSTWIATVVVLIGGISFSTRSAFSQQKPQILIAQAATIKAESAQEETLYLNNDRTYSYNLVAQERGVIDGVTIPAGATIVGKYVPAEGGLRYVAEAVTYDDYSYTINASSGVIKDVKDPRDTSAGAIAKDAGIGAAGGTILGEVFGDAGATEIIGGAAAGAAVGNLTADRVVVIEPDSAIALYD